MAVDWCWCTLNTGPCTDPAVPSDDRISNECIVLDLRVLEDDRLLDSDACSDNRAWADRDVWTKLGSWVDLCSWMNKHWWEDVRGWLCELWRAVIHCLLQVKGVSWDCRSGSLDLAPEVLGLVYEELLGVGHVGEDILLKTEYLVLLVLVIGEEAGLEVLAGWVGVKAWAVRAALDGATNGWENRVGAEEVDAAVDEVGDVGFWLLDVVKDTARVRVGDDASEVGGSVLADAGTENDGLSIALLEELEHVHEWEGAADVGVQDEEALWLALQDGVAEVVETTCGSESLILAEILDSELWELGGGVLDEVAENVLLIVSNHADLLNIWNLCDGGKAVPDDWVSSNIEEWLRQREKRLMW